MNGFENVFNNLMEKCEKNYENNRSDDDYIGKDGLMYCSNCHTAKQCLTPRVLHLEPRIVGCRCKCQRERDEAEQARAKLFAKVQYNTAHANIPEHFRHSRVNMLEGKDRILAENYLKSFYEENGKTIGLLLHGDVGTGKTFFSGCIANALLNNGYSVRWLSVMQIVELGSFYSDQQFQEYIDEIIRPDMLIIDDLGAERGTEYALSRVFSLVDTRATADKPMLVTTNVRVKEMGQCDDLRRKRTFDRVLEKCFPYAMVGVSKRMLSAKDNYDRYSKKFLGE